MSLYHHVLRFWNLQWWGQRHKYTLSSVWLSIFYHGGNKNGNSAPLLGCISISLYLYINLLTTINVKWTVTNIYGYSTNKTCLWSNFVLKRCKTADVSVKLLNPCREIKEEHVCVRQESERLKQDTKTMTGLKRRLRRQTTRNAHRVKDDWSPFTFVTYFRFCGSQPTPLWIYFSAAHQRLLGWKVSISRRRREKERTQKHLAWQNASFLRCLRMKFAVCWLVLAVTFLNRIIRRSNVEGNQQKCENTTGIQEGRWWVTVA